LVHRVCDVRPTPALQLAFPLVVQHHPSIRGNASCAERAENWRAMRETAAILGMPATRTNTH
jgi:hypothetical protein